jgi:5-methylcytosine-specific restriction endonuclease McrA
MAKKKKKDIRANFRHEVFERDNYHCKVCGVHDPYADAHHITDRNEMPNQGMVPSNGITLCTECHKKAEVWHDSGKTKWEVGYHQDELYKLIESSYDKALEDSEKLNDKEI